MGKPDIRRPAPLTHGDLTVDGSGYLYDAAMRRAVVEMGGEPVTQSKLSVTSSGLPAETTAVLLESRGKYAN